MSDKVTLVNEQDEVIGEMDKIEAHRGKAHLHRAISVYLFRKNPETEVTELLVQQRSHKKIVGALQWANTACGNVWPGESYEACARRRLMFELGISVNAQELPLHPVEKFIYQVQCNAEFSEHEMDQVFAGWYDGAVTPNPDEVAAVEWVSWEPVQDAEHRALQQKDWAPWFKIMMLNQKIIGELRKFTR